MHPKNWRSFDTQEQKEFSYVYYYLFAGIALVVAAFLFARPASAQTEGPEVGDTAASAPGETLAEPPSVEASPILPIPVVEALPSGEIEPVESSPSLEVIADEAVSAEDLGVTESRILPDSPWYGFKRFGRGLQEAFTFNPVKKAELRLEHANQELVDSQALIQQKPNDADAMQAATGAIERFEQKVGKIAEKTEALRERQARGDAEADQLLNVVLDHQIKQQKLLDGIEERVFEDAHSTLNGEMIETIANAKEQTSEHMGDVIVGMERDPERLQARIDQMLDGQRGSEFKHLRNVEVLSRLEEKVPEQARDAIRQAGENALKRFNETFEQLGEGDRKAKFAQYVERIGGDKTRQLEIFDRLKQLEGIPPEIAGQIEVAKDIAARRFEQRLEQFNDFEGDFRVRAQERVFARFSEGRPDISKLRVMEEIRQRVTVEDENLKKDIEQRREAAIEKFKQEFPDADQDAEAFRKLSAQMAQNPDPTTFRLIQELEERVKADPKKREFIERMEREAKQQFVVQAAQGKEKFFEKISSSNPGDVEIFKKLQQEFTSNPEQFSSFSEGEDDISQGGALGVQGGFQKGFIPPGFSASFFDAAIKKHSDVIVNQLQGVSDPRAFEQFQKKFQDAPKEVLDEFRRRGNIDQIFGQKRDAIQEQVSRQQFEKDRIQLEQEFRGRLDQAGSEEDKQSLEQSFRARKDEFKQKEFQVRQEFFEKNLQFDPFCDDRCRAQERGRYQESIQQEKEQFKGQIPPAPTFKPVQPSFQPQSKSDEGEIFKGLKPDFNNPSDSFQKPDIESQKEQLKQDFQKFQDTFGKESPQNGSKPEPKGDETFGPPKSSEGQSSPQDSAPPFGASPQSQPQPQSQSPQQPSPQSSSQPQSSPSFSPSPSDSGSSPSFSPPPSAPSGGDSGGGGSSGGGFSGGGGEGGGF